ncbi:response regulator [Roseococcus pinisoli]|uniref:Response regulator transcription factor n=1 Tax=Roseococcus pinisoli TaxID=2835040 RepID=A0ABS5QFX5_9PROT|nr:response regulator transcription factor [Roseococcus pinisoli]MBS7811850.1 response regulator transcription factor [Roseococcus pinisoli]
MRREPGPLRILLADDHDVVRHGLRALLETHEGWTICGEALSGRQAVEMAEKLQPDIAILDISMPSLNGLDATRIIRRSSPRTEILIFTMHETEQLIREVLAAGAKGYLLKSDAGRSVIAAIEALAAHQPYFNWKVSETILDGFLRAAAPDDGTKKDQEPLTTREREIVQLLAEGLSNKEVAKRLELSVKTVETHRSSAMRKLDVHSVVGLVHYAVRNKLTPI